ncbi:protein of unknown function [Micromonospora echinaurantiaca]|uniref:DUF305 domain-containing protein n=1 Tax=Micromonospora echinaurantiaca TaxID=47857 RepID=A0A1C5IAN3_9ACTN|nr:DUF305 domain-containing protein [Micromonospora echinaurantiaca]SCG55470.1 protein of unknown function [Micromonospora echinaurantiaca]
MRPAVPPLLVAVALLVAGCAGDAGPSAASPHPAAPGGGAPTSSDAAAPAGTASGGTASGGGASGGAAGAFNPTDVAWLQLHVAMTDRMLPVLDVVPAGTGDPAWRLLAARLGTAHRADLARSRQLLAGSGAPTTNPHEGHDMPGMVTADELATLRAATGVPLHRLLARHLRAYLTQLARLAAAEQRAGSHPATTALAAAIARQSRSELAHLDRLDHPASPAPAGAGHAGRDQP